MNHEIEAALVLGDALEHRFHLTGRAHVEWHKDGGLELAGERIDYFLALSLRYVAASSAPKARRSPGVHLAIRLVLYNPHVFGSYGA